MQVKQISGFDKFNPMQAKALAHGIYDKSVVISAPTASGKTLVSELAALNCILNKGKKVIYTCPLKAIASEHSREFKKKYGANFLVRIALSTGDMDSSSKYLSRYDLIYCTNEKLDSLIRHQAEWLRDIGLLIVDEVHELDSDRGATLEMVISKLRFIIPELQVLALSATIPNSKEIADWLNAGLVESDYRPVKLKEGILFDKTVHFGKEELALKGEEELLSLIEDTLEQKKQALFFLNTRRNAEAMAKKAAKTTEKRLLPLERISLQKLSDQIESVLEIPTEQCKSLSSLVRSGTAFHHAGLLPKQKELIEDAFRERKIKILSATTSLAAGVNLPAFRVVIPSLYRFTSMGMQRIPVREYKQMCLPRDSKIVTEEHGDLGIGEIVENELKCKVLSFNEYSGTFEFKSIANFYKNNSSDMVCLKTQLGNELRLTPNHSVFVKEKDAFVWKKSSDIEIGDKIVHQKRTNINFEKSPYLIDLLPKEKTYVKNCGRLIIDAKEKLGITEKKLAKQLGINYKISFHYKTNKKAMPFKVASQLCAILDYSKEKKAQLIGEVKTAYGASIILPERVNADFLWLAGFIATDGNINRSIDKRTKSEYIKLRAFNTNENIIKKVKSILLKFGLVPYESKREDGLITLEFGATLLCRILRGHFGIPYGNKTSSVRIPEFLMNLGPDLIGAYLGGVFDGDGNYNEGRQRYNSKVRRALIVSSSKAFAQGIQKLLLKIGILAKISTKLNNSLVIIRNKKAHFSKPVYYIVFRKIECLKKFQKLAKITKCKIDVEYSDYNNIRNFHDKGDSEFESIKIIEKNKFVYKKPVYNIGVKDNNNYFADNVLVHNCGRAGRPSFDSTGESIVVAKSEPEFDEIKERYVEGDLEAITSKLSFEPILRMHLLALIASHFVFDHDSMESFFKSTFYGFQFGDLDEIMEKLESLLEELIDYGFVEEKKERFTATATGHRVSDLYLDPVSARKLLDALEKELDVFSALFSLVNSSEFAPYFSAGKKNEPELWRELLESEEKLPVDVAREQFLDPDLLNKFNSALLLREWVSEKSDQQLMEEFNVQPGILFSNLRICDWLAYSAIELLQLSGRKENLPVLMEARKRLKYGVKRELLPLVELRGIGRVRARRLFRGNLRSVNDLKKVSFQQLAGLLGGKLAADLKRQLGQKVDVEEEIKAKERKPAQSSLSSFD